MTARIMSVAGEKEVFAGGSRGTPARSAARPIGSGSRSVGPSQLT